MLSFGTMVMLQFFDRVDVYMLLVVRLAGFFVILPVLSGANIPVTVRVLLAVSIAGCLFAANAVPTVAYDDNVVGFSFLILKEFFVGFIIAFAAYFVFSILYMAGQLIDYEIGFAMVSVLDPVTQIQVPVVGNLLYLFMCLFLVQSGGLHTFVAAIAYSYEVVPAGEAFIVGNSNLMMYVLQLFASYAAVGVKIALPIVSCMMVVTVALGLLVKAVPQMNVFVVGIPLKLLAGLIVLYVLLPVYAAMSNEIFELSFRAMQNVIGGLAP